MRRLAGWMTLAALAAVCYAAVPALAQEDLEKQVGEKMQASIEGMNSMHAVMAFDVAVNGNPMPMPNLGMEMWFKRDNYTRTEMAFPPMVMCQSPTEAVIYMGMTGKALHIPEETLKQFQDKRDEMLKQAGMSTDPAAMFAAFAKMGGYKVVGDATVEGQDCWQLEIQPESLDSVVEAAKSFMPNMGGIAPKFNAFAMAVQKDTGMVRKIDLDMTMAMGGGPEMQLGLGITMKEIEVNIGIPDAIFDYQPPAEATVIEWTPDRNAEDVLAEFGGGMMGGAPGGQN